MVEDEREQVKWALGTGTTITEHNTLQRGAWGATEGQIGPTV